MRAYPGYDWMRQAVSDLTAVDAPSFSIASRFSSVYGSLSCLGCVAVALVVKGVQGKAFRRGVFLYAAMNWVSTIGYALFPLSGSGFKGTFQDVMHFYVVTMAVVLLSIVSLSMIVVGGIRRRGGRLLAVLALAALACMFFGSIGIGAFPPAYFGLMERFSVFSVVLFTAALGVFGFLAPTGDR